MTGIAVVVSGILIWRRDGRGGAKGGSGADKDAVAAADERLSAGGHCWEVEITKGDGSIMVGVCKAHQGVVNERGARCACA